MALAAEITIQVETLPEVDGCLVVFPLSTGDLTQIDQAVCDGHLDVAGAPDRQALLLQPFGFRVVTERQGDPPQKIQRRRYPEGMANRSPGSQGRFHTLPSFDEVAVLIF